MARGETGNPTDRQLNATIANAHAVLALLEQLREG
jgi:hypothetical protein